MHGGVGEGFDIIDGGVPNMLERETETVFCLAPTGHGWGTRLKVALLCGCIPVVIGDDVAVCTLQEASHLTSVLDLMDVTDIHAFLASHLALLRILACESFDSPDLTMFPSQKRR